METQDSSPGPLHWAGAHNGRSPCWPHQLGYSTQPTIQDTRLPADHLIFLLVEHARNENDVVVISLFVNPAQFAPNEDFDAYPRTWETDKAMIDALNLKSVAVFMPTNSEMYPRGISLDVKNQQGAFVEVLGLSEQVHPALNPPANLPARRPHKTSFFPRGGNRCHKALQHHSA